MVYGVQYSTTLTPTMAGKQTSVSITLISQAMCENYRFSSHEKTPNEVLSVWSNCVKLHTIMGLDRNVTFPDNSEPSLVLIQLSLINIKVLFIHQLRH